MVTTPLASALYSRFAAAPAEWFRSPEGQALIARGIALVREREGDDAAAALENLCTCCLCIS